MDKLELWCMDIEKKIKSIFITKSLKGNRLKLKYNKLSKAITIDKNKIFNEDYARLAGLTPDGSLIKDLMRIYFSQKKDVSKHDLFKKLLTKLFSPKATILIKPWSIKSTESYINSQTLARFYYHIMEIPKSDEAMRVPSWVYKSKEKIKIAYLQEAFAMEGTILKKLSEIRFVSKQEVFVNDIQKLLLSLKITSSITYAPRLKQPSGQYRVSIYSKKNFKEFKKIGFNDCAHKDRYKEHLKKYKL